jgi:hypothetical protein
MKKDPQGSFFFLAPQVRGRDAESLLGESGLIGQFKKQLAERMFGVVEGTRIPAPLPPQPERLQGHEAGRWCAGVNTLNASVLALAEKKKARAKSDLYEMVETRRIELPTFALRTRHSPS